MGEFDAIVVGGGPGGSSAAYFLAKQGVKVAVIEKKSFPRVKTCGDGLTPRAIKVLERIGVPLGEYQAVKGLRVKGAGRTLEMEFPKLKDFAATGYVRARSHLDSDIATAAQAAGATYLFNTEAARPHQRNGHVDGVEWTTKRRLEDGSVEKSDEGVIRAPFTIVADGASSSFGRALGIARRTQGFPMGLAIRTYYNSHMSSDDYLESWLELRRGDELLPGYGWIFPMNDGTVNVGVGLLTTFGKWREVNLNELQRAFVEMLPEEYGISHETQVSPYQAGRLPMGQTATRTFGPGYLLIGDAAGFINPFNGEGIAYALETGQIAAAHVAASLENGRSHRLQEYGEELNDTYGGYYRAGRKFSRIIGKPRLFRAICALGLRVPPLMEFVFQVLANLGDSRGGSLGSRTIRLLHRLKTS